MSDIQLVNDGHVLSLSFGEAVLLLEDHKRALTMLRAEERDVKDPDAIRRTIKSLDATRLQLLKALHGALDDESEIARPQ